MNNINFVNKMFAGYSATELLFHYLVQKSEEPLDMTTKILIPDTIIYKYILCLTVIKVLSTLLLVLHNCSGLHHAREQEEDFLQNSHR